MAHTLSYCALIGKCALIRSNTVFIYFFSSKTVPELVDWWVKNQPYNCSTFLSKAGDAALLVENFGLLKTAIILQQSAITLMCLGIGNT